MQNPTAAFFKAGHQPGFQLATHSNNNGANISSPLIGSTSHPHYNFVTTPQAQVDMDFYVLLSVSNIIITGYGCIYVYARKT
jgi:hypothetical protein